MQSYEYFATKHQDCTLSQQEKEILFKKRREQLEKKQIRNILGGKVLWEKKLKFISASLYIYEIQFQMEV